jgi:quinol monooxygenase YgiN
MEGAMVGLLVRFEAKPGQEKAVEGLIRELMPIIREETGTTTFFAVRFGSSAFGIFDTFDSDAERQAHVGGRAAAMLFGRAGDLFAGQPSIEPFEVADSKLPVA